LQEQQMKDRNQIVKLKERLDAVEGRKRFDPAKAFQHAKENDQPQQQHVRDGEICQYYLLLLFFIPPVVNVSGG